MPYTKSVITNTLNKPIQSLVMLLFSSVISTVTFGLSPTIVLNKFIGYLFEKLRSWLASILFHQATNCCPVVIPVGVVAAPP